MLLDFQVLFVTLLNLIVLEMFSGMKPIPKVTVYLVLLIAQMDLFMRLEPTLWFS